MKKNKYTTGFKIPEGYFDEFDAYLLDKLKEEHLPKDSGFTVPEGYFDAVEEKIIQNQATSNWKVLRTKKSENKGLHRKSVLYTIVGIAAVLAIVLTLYPFGATNSFSFDDLNASSVSAYIQDGEIDFTEDDLSIYFKDEDFDALVIPFREISDKNLSDYLINNLDDDTLLLE